MDEAMLSDIVARAVRRKSRWKPATWDPEDMVQEAWAAVLEAQRDGINDPEELQRLAELRLITLMSKENESLASAVPWLTEEHQGVTEFDDELRRILEDEAQLPNAEED